MPRATHLLGWLGAMLVLLGCTSGGTGSPTFRPVPGLPSNGALPSVPPRSPSATADSDAAAFDPSTVSVTLQAFASVPGGPLAITAPRDGSGRLFVAAQDGRAWVVNGDGSTLSTPLLDLRNVVSSGGERGLLGLALHPGFPTDPRAFTDYTDRDGNTVVASYRLSATNPNVLDSSSAQLIFQAAQPYPNHNGGALAFGPDGDLYISLGDGGGGGDPQGNGQRLDTTLGKVLRIDVDRPADGRAYGIPQDNPFASDPSKRGEIWLYGLRNPWRMSFDRMTGDLWMGDVGQAAWEEVDVARRGASGLDFGWNRMEGAHCFQPPQGCDLSGLTMPVAEYGHDQGCVVIGGVVYRGSRYPMLADAYLFADYCSGRIWALDAASAAPTTAPAAPILVGSGGGEIVAFGEDEAGDAYVASLDGTISLVVAARR